MDFLPQSRTGFRIWIQPSKAFSGIAEMGSIDFQPVIHDHLLAGNVLGRESQENPGARRDAAGKRPRNTAQFPGNPAAGGLRIPQGRDWMGLTWIPRIPGIGSRIPSAPLWMDATPQLNASACQEFPEFHRISPSSRSWEFPQGHSPSPKNPVPFRNSLLGLSNP